MTKTLLLDQAAWDLVLDGSGNIALASEPYAIAQNVATACRTFVGECIFDTTLGIPYWEQVLGKLPPEQYVRQQLIDAALTVPEVVEVTPVLLAPTDRGIGGQLQIVDTSGQSTTVNF